MLKHQYVDADGRRRSVAFHYKENTDKQYAGWVILLFFCYDQCYMMDKRGGEPCVHFFASRQK